MRALRFLAPSIVAGATTALVVAAFHAASNEPPEQSPPTPRRDFTYEECIDELVLGRSSGCWVVTGPRAGTWLISAPSKGRCENSVTFETTPTVCVVTDGPNRGATLPVAFAP